jgi:small-conductance mechanosensitive channel
MNLQIIPFHENKGVKQYMEIKDKEKSKRSNKAPRTALISLLVMIIFICVILTTDAVAKNSGLSFIGKHEKTIVNTELAIFSLILVEFIGKAIIQAFKNRGIEPVGHNVRAILRGIVYLILAIGIVSSLSSNPGLAIGIGTVTGIVIAFATQNLVGNIFAGVLLAIVRPVRIGDYVTVLLSSGEVKEIALMYTILEDGENWYYVPSMVMFSNVIKRKKAPVAKIP